MTARKPATVEERHRRAAVEQLLRFVGEEQAEWVATGKWQTKKWISTYEGELERNARARADAERAAEQRGRAAGVLIGMTEQKRMDEETWHAIRPTLIAEGERAGRIAGLREGFELGERWIGWKTADEARKELEQRICELEDGDGA